MRRKVPRPVDSAVIKIKYQNYEAGEDDPDVDNEVLIDATTVYLKTGDFYEVEITDAADFDLYGKPINVETRKPVRKELKIRTV